jgi:hypothetical protein
MGKGFATIQRGGGGGGLTLSGAGVSLFSHTVVLVHSNM